MEESKQLEVYRAIGIDREFRHGVVMQLSSVLTPRPTFNQDEAVFCIGIALRMVEAIRPYDIARFIAIRDKEIDAEKLFDLWHKTASKILSKQASTAQ